MTTKEMSDFLNSLWCWARCTEEEQRKLSEIADYLSNRGNEKNDCISRADALDCVNWGYSFSDIYKKINELPSVTPQEPKSFKWCETCKEYDQEKHCCHRYSKVIRDTVAEMKQEQESVLDKLRADIQAYTDSQGFINISEYRFNSIIDKYKAEMRVDNGNNNH